MQFSLSHFISKLEDSTVHLIPLNSSYLLLISSPKPKIVTYGHTVAGVRFANT